MASKKIINKLNIKGPRYTSYPTVPEWKKTTSDIDYKKALTDIGKKNKAYSLYIHIPYCKNKCKFCGCSSYQTPKNNNQTKLYLKSLEKEMQLLKENIGKPLNIHQLHLGGGSPDFLDISELELLFKYLDQHFKIDTKKEIAVESSPKTMSLQKLAKFHELGVNRLSLGIQDLDPIVLKHINRTQSLSKIKKITEKARTYNFKSINFDLIYGLPYQTQASFKKTITKIITLKPNRIALYSFAYLPASLPNQKELDNQALPSTEEKIQIFLMAREKLLFAGYLPIGMDHFALPEDDLYHAYVDKTLTRNFMGYTSAPSAEYLGLGATAISFIENIYFQNTKNPENYLELLNLKTLPVAKKKPLTNDDLIRKWVIQMLMCQFEINKEQFHKIFNQDFDNYFKSEQNHINKCLNDKLISLDDKQLIVTDFGKLFIRNICMGFDIYLKQNKETNFSKTV